MRPAPFKPYESILTGIDLVSIRRVERLLTDNPGVANELLTEHERQYCFARPRPAPSVAARFAAKEAVLKAMGTGLGPGMRWTDVEVVLGVTGRPVVRLYGKVADWATKHAVQTVSVSLSHTGEFAVAGAVLWCKAQSHPDYPRTDNQST